MARDYSPEIGRYVQFDPTGLRGGINGYLYANASPLKFTDSDGLSAVPAGSASIISEAPSGTGSAGGQSSSSGAMMMCAASDRSACYEMCDVIRSSKVFACAGNPACWS
jgi:uncharacterized protein RhaS with RHS repeats